MERVAEEKLLAMLPDELRPTYSAALSPAAPEIQQLVKAADKLSAYIKCLEELKAGNTEFKQAAEQTRYAAGRHGAAGAGLFSGELPAVVQADAG